MKLFDEEGVELWHGDSRVIVPSWAAESCDSVITDPPYGIDKRYGRTTVGEGNRTIVGDADTKLLTWVFGEAARIIRAPGWCCVFCGYSTVGEAQAAAKAASLRVATVIVWDKMSPGLGAGLRNQYEMIVVASKGQPRIGYNGGNVWREARIIGRRPSHPNEKPLSLMIRLVGCFGGEYTADPFAGAGTTLVAARRLGKAAKGVEIDERFVGVAVDRLRAEAGGGRLPVPRGGVVGVPEGKGPRAEVGGADGGEAGNQAGSAGANDRIPGEGGVQGQGRGEGPAWAEPDPEDL